MSAMQQSGAASRKVRVALIGAGGMATGYHYPSLAEMPDVHLAALCDLDKDRREIAAERLQISETYADYRAMLDEAQPDAVYAIMPPHQVFDAAIEVMNRKRHLFIEKPPGVTAFQTRHLALCAKRNEVIAMCGFQRRYVPIITELHGRVTDQSPLHTVVVTFVKCSYPMGGYYNGAIDILSCDAVHAVDLLRHLCGGEALTVASDVRTLGAEDHNAFYALIRFSTGVTGILQTNWACGRRFFKVEMHAQGVSAYADPDEGATLYRGGDTEGQVFDPAVCAGNPDERHRLGFYAENRHFIDCVLEGKQPVSSLRDTVATMELVDRIYHSQI